MKYSRYTPKQIANAVEMLKTMTILEVAKKTKITRGLLYYWIEKYEITLVRSVKGRKSKKDLVKKELENRGL